MTFSESNAFFGSEKLTLTSFQTFFFGLTETFTSVFTWNKENLKDTFSSWIVKEWYFQKLFLCLQICSVNVYLLLKLVPGLTQTAHETLVEFGDTKPIPLRMNNDFKIIWFWLLATNAWLFSNAPLGLPKYVHQMLSEVPRWWGTFLMRVCGRTELQESLLVFGNMRLLFNCFKCGFRTLPHVGSICVLGV